MVFLIEFVVRPFRWQQYSQSYQYLLSNVQRLHGSLIALQFLIFEMVPLNSKVHLYQAFNKFLKLKNKKIKLQRKINLVNYVKNLYQSFHRICLMVNRLSLFSACNTDTINVVSLLSLTSAHLICVSTNTSKLRLHSFASLIIQLKFSTPISCIFINQLLKQTNR